MLNEDRVILMTRMASYEKGEGKKNSKIGNYFRSDYIALQVLKAIVSGTLAFVVVLALYILYDFEVFMGELYNLEYLIAFAGRVLIYYGISVVSYALLVYVVCTVRYAKAKKSLKNFYHNLKKLNSLYGEQK